MQFSLIYGEVGSNFPTATTSRAKMAVNAAYHEWLAARQWSYREASTATIALTAGTSVYTLLGTTPIVPDFDGLIDVVLEMSTGLDFKTLTELSQQNFDRVFGHVTTNGEPAVYCVRGSTPAASAATMTQGGQQQLAISPPPLATATHGQKLTIRYFRSVGSMEMVADTDIPLVPSQYHYALILGANAYMQEAIGGNPAKAQAWRQLFKERISEAVSSDQGLRLRDQQLLEFRPPSYIYPITGQSPPTFDPQTRPYDPR